MRTEFLSNAALAALVALALAACSGEAPETTDETAGDLVVETADDSLWSATSSRLGPIGAGTPYSLDALQDALPEFTLVEAGRSAEGMSYSVYEARLDGDGSADLVFDGVQGRLLAVRIRTAGLVEAAADIGETAGSAGFDFDDCFPGVEERSGDVVCPDPRGNGLNYWIAVDHAGPDGELPPAETIASGEVYEINWQPTAG